MEDLRLRIEDQQVGIGVQGSRNADLSKLGLRIEDQQVGIGVQGSRNVDLRHLGLNWSRISGFQER